MYGRKKISGTLSYDRDPSGVFNADSLMGRFSGESSQEFAFTCPLD